jgi:hypothetical protein
MKTPLKLRLLAAGVLVLATAGCLRINVQGDPARALDQLETAMRQAVPVRVATYNTSLYSDEDGGLIRRLENDDDKARRIAAVLQRVRPDLVLLNEFDYDPAQRAADLFQHDYLETPQSAGGACAPLSLSLPGARQYRRCQWAGPRWRRQGRWRWPGPRQRRLGLRPAPGQYGMLVLSRYPIEVADVRTFQLLKWSAMPDAMQPIDPASRRHHYPDAIWKQLRLSSKSHWDLPCAHAAGRGAPAGIASDAAGVRWTGKPQRRAQLRRDQALGRIPVGWLRSPGCAMTTGVVAGLMPMPGS